jgi:uncharacterized protein YdeI (YjbR/CyaY-like superfamily)
MIEPPKNSFHPKTRSAWRTWLSKHHEQGDGVWLISWKKASGKPSIAYDELVQEALCFGWIDSKPNKLDDERSMLWFAPRKSGSGWSRPNKERVVALTAAGRMMPPGLAKIDAAKKDGTWNALDAVEALEIPVDLLSAFVKHKAAAENFEKFPRSAKRGILEWISNAKTPPTRAKRVTETADLAAINERANQWPKLKINE